MGEEGDKELSEQHRELDIKRVGGGWTSSNHIVQNSQRTNKNILKLKEIIKHEGCEDV